MTSGHSDGRRVLDVNASLSLLLDRVHEVPAQEARLLAQVPPIAAALACEPWVTHEGLAGNGQQPVPGRIRAVALAASPVNAKIGLSALADDVPDGMHAGGPVQKTTYDITPDPTLMEKIGFTSFTVAEAVSELVANSFDARVEEERVTVVVSVTPDDVLVVDNGMGMTGELLAKAVTLGVEMVDVLPNRRATKGMFGLGMKTACASLGRQWTVRTRPAGEQTEYSVSFDLAEFTKRASRSEPWKVEVVSDAPDLGGPLGRRESGTAVIVNQLRERNPMAGAVLTRLGEAFKGHLESGDVIQVNGNDAKPFEYTFLEGSRGDFTATVTSGGKEHEITGWVAVDTKTHNEGLFGINIYRRGQLVEAWNKDWFKAHLMTSRVIGDVHIDFAERTFYAKGFKQGQLWKDISKTMREVLVPWVRASQTAGRGRDDSLRFVKAAKGLAAAVQTCPAAVELDQPQTAAVGDALPETEQPQTAGGRTAEDPQVEVGPETIRLPTGDVRLTFEIYAMETEETPWSAIYYAERRELLAVVNSESLLFQKVKDTEFLGILALADCVTGFLVERQGMKPADARMTRDRWLMNALQASEHKAGAKA